MSMIQLRSAERGTRNFPNFALTLEPRENIERPTSNTERRSERGFALPFDVRRWMFDVGCSSGFMGSEHLQNSDVNRSHEPVGIPLNRPSGTFSPIGGEGRDEGGGSWKAPFRFCACIGTMNHPLTRPSAALSPSDGEREGMRGRFMESPLSFLPMHWDHEPPLTRPFGHP